MSCSGSYAFVFQFCLNRLYFFVAEPKSCPQRAVVYVSSVWPTQRYVSLFAYLTIDCRNLLWRTVSLSLERCADICPILFSANSINTIYAFHFSRLRLYSPPSALHPSLTTPAHLLLLPPLAPHPFSLSVSILLSWASSNLEQGLHFSKVTQYFKHPWLWQTCI